MKTLRPVHPFQIELALFGKLAWFDEQEPGARRHEAREVCAIRRRGFQHRDRYRLQSFEASLRRDIEPSDRFDIIAKQFDANRVVRIGRKDVQNAATQRKFAGQLDRRRRMATALHQPAREFLLIELRAHSNLARGRGKRIATRHRLQQALDARDKNGGDFGFRISDFGLSFGIRIPGYPLGAEIRNWHLLTRRQLFQYAQSFPVNLIMYHTLARLRFPSRKHCHRCSAE